MKTSDNHILVPIDFSEQSLLTIKQSYNLARFHHSDITLLYVIDGDFLHKLTHLFKGDTENENRLRAETTERLQQIADETKAESGLNVNIVVTSGKIYDEIVRVSIEINAVMIIMGTNGGTDSIKKKFIGSNAIRVINEAKCPVISIRGKQHRQGCKRIVLPLDLSLESRDKVNKAIEIAKYFNSEINIISLYDTNDEFLISKLKLQMQNVQQFIIDEGVTATSELVLSKDTSDTVIEYANRVDADLIIIISQADLEIKEWFLGTEAQDIINNSEIPVLSVRAMERKDTYDSVLS
jgi:nucleotide-binding universal stress UspA family protein